MDQTVEQMNAFRGPFTEAMGVVFDSLADDRITGHVVVGPEHHQPFGIVHGGVYCSIVETFGSVGASIAASRLGKIVVGVSNTTDFLRPVREGRLEIVAEPLHLGRLQQLWLVEIFREDGKVVARGQLRGQLLEADRDLAGQPPSGSIVS